MDENSKSKRASKAWEVVMSNITDDLWTEIFLRLPFESLLRFKSVSKTWLSIISSHRFALSHLAMAPKDDQILIVHSEAGKPEEGDDGDFSLYHLDSRGINVENLNFPYSQGEYPFEPDHSQLIGSECGIVCVSVCVSGWNAAKNNYDLYLWNPATKQSKLIPPYTIPDDMLGALGFGFDHTDLDFKVVRFLSGRVSAEVYSSNKNDWRKIKHELINISGHVEFNVCFHGFLLATGYCSGIRGIIAFDLNKEVFICDIKLPVGGSSGTHIAQYKDTIAFIFYDSFGDSNVIKLWTLDNEACLSGNGVEASWTKVLSLDVGMSFYFVEGLFNNDQFLLFGVEGERLLYNSNNKLTKKVPSYPNRALFTFLSYTKSLFSLTGFKRIKWAASSLRSQKSSELELKMDE